MVAFFNLWRRELARPPGTMEPSPAWASRLAERDLHTVTITTCARCHNDVDNLPNAVQTPLDRASVVPAHLRPGPAYACVNATCVQ